VNEWNLEEQYQVQMEMQSAMEEVENVADGVENNEDFVNSMTWNRCYKDEKIQTYYHRWFVQYDVL
jgi:hypothetical protein